ncbi:family 10 glycosylhydrolase [Anoxybacterium hadale]|uniref:family 10 glycosylhydrolase n=1 Tax=Anoxybacterium hadale TaxID=3408580 RepID=UPI003B00BE8A
MNKVRKQGFGSKGVLAAAMLLLISAFCVYPWWETSAMGESDIKVKIDGETVVFQSGYGEPFIDANNRTLVPVRGALEAFGAMVSWDEANSMVIVEKDRTMVKVPIGNAAIIVNGVSVMNDTAAVIQNERTYLPIRAVFEAFGAGVSWDDSNRSVVVNSDGSGSDNNSGSGTNQPAVPGSTGNHSGSSADDKEMRAMWISYLEYMEMPKNEAGFKAAVDKMFDRSVELGMNAVIVHVRSHSDAMYPSAYYPWSIFASGTQGIDPGYDPLAYMVSAAHSRGLEFHAWLNPYRVTGYGTYWNQTAASNPVRIWQSDGDPANDRWALLHKGEYYLNPSVPEARALVINGIKEIVENYDVDGIHFDDYFYPTVNDKDASLCFDKPEYDASGSSMSIADWRRNNVNLLVKDIYSAVKQINPKVEFGISPAGNVDNLRRNDSYFVDIDTWMSKSGYIDYIMPQLYWGFERKDSSGNVAAYAYENNLNTWIKLAAKGDVKLFVGLNMANAGCNVSDNNQVSEWLRYNDIIARQVLAARATGKVDGFAFFRYAMFNSSVAKGEVENLVKVCK